MNVYKRRSEAKNETKPEDASSFYSKLGLGLFLPPQKKDVTSYKIPKVVNKQSGDSQTSRVSSKQSVVAKIPNSSSQQTYTAHKARSQTGIWSSSKNTEISTKHTAVSNAASKFDRQGPRDKNQSTIKSSNPPKRIAWNSRKETGISKVSATPRSRDHTVDHGQKHPSEQEQLTSYCHPNAYLSYGFWNHQQQYHRDSEFHAALQQPTIGLHSANNKSMQLTNGKADHRSHESSSFLAFDHQIPDVRSQIRPDINQKEVYDVKQKASNTWSSSEQGDQQKVRLSSRELLQKIPHKSVPRTLSTKTKESELLPEKKIESIENLFPEPVCENDAQMAEYLPKLPQEEIDSIVENSRKPTPLSMKSRRAKRTFEVVEDYGVIDLNNDSKRPKFSFSDHNISEEMEDLAVRLLSGKPLRNIACDIKNEIFEKVRQSRQINSKLEFFDHSYSPIPFVNKNNTENNPHFRSRETVSKVVSMRSHSSTDTKTVNIKPVQLPIVNFSQSVSAIRSNTVNHDQGRPNTRPATAHDTSKPITRCQLKLEDETVLVHIMEKISPMRLMKPVPNTRTPCPSPSRHLEMQSLLSHIPYSSASLIQRADIKAKFLSERQAKCPNEQLFKNKAVCEFNLDTVYDFKTNTWKQHKNFGRPVA